MSDEIDRARVRRSATRVGLLVGAASALVLTAGVVILVSVLVLTARPDDHPREPRERLDGDRFVVDVDRILPWVIVLGIIGVIMLAAVGWVAARWAVSPLAAALRSQRNFVSDASHELRTPLTALTSRIQILQRRWERDQPIDDTIQDLRRDAVTMDAVLTDMLVAAESSAAHGSADVVAGIENAVSALRPIAEESGIVLETASVGRPTAAIPEVTLTRLCVALIDNAIQHSPTGGVVTISAQAAGRDALVRVMDHGPGIPAADVERVFERFARSGESGRRRGFGLGLALVRETALRYGGGVRVEHTSPGGTTLLLTVPLS